MKKILLMAIFALTITTISAQEMFKRDSVIQAQHLTADQIFDGVKNSFVSLFKHANDVIQIEDKEKGNIVGKFTFPLKIGNMTFGEGSGQVAAVIDVKIREGRFKVTLRDFIHTSNSRQYSDWWSMGVVRDTIPEEWQKGGKWAQKRGVYKSLLPACEEYSNTVINFLSESIQSYNPASEAEEEW